MKILLALAACVVGAGILLLLYLLPRMPASPHYVQKDISVGTTILRVDIADTEALQTTGLSGRSSLDADTGMLFVFPKNDSWGIWMKDMQFAIDIIWLDENGDVITIARNVVPDTYPQAFYPTKPARYVVEVPAGYAQAHGIAEGNRFVLYGKAI